MHRAYSMSFKLFLQRHISLPNRQGLFLQRHISLPNRQGLPLSEYFPDEAPSPHHLLLHGRCHHQSELSQPQ